MLGVTDKLTDITNYDMLFTMVRYVEDVAKRISKGLIPQDVFLHIDNVFTAVDITKDLRLFDIKQLKVSKGASRIYYRLRKGKYRALFYTESDDVVVIALDKREDVYRKWL